MDLTVKVTDDFSLDAGKVIEHPERSEAILILPPATSMFNQLWEWLQDLPEPNIGYNYWAFGIGATALCLRWGTYLAVLMDEFKPVDPRAADPYYSMISDQEMKRINIEASASLAFILRMWAFDETRCRDILRRAYEWLPMPQRRVKRNQVTLEYILGAYEKARELKDGGIFDSCRTALAHPFRALANTIIALAYRNAPVESVHAGQEAAYRLDYRRFTTKQYRDVIRSPATHISAVMYIPPLWGENLLDFPPWPQRVIGLPYIMLYPHDWTMTESTSEIVLLKEWLEDDAWPCQVKR